MQLIGSPRIAGYQIAAFMLKMCVAIYPLLFLPSIVSPSQSPKRSRLSTMASRSAKRWFGKIVRQLLETPSAQQQAIARIVSGASGPRYQLFKWYFRLSNNP